MPRRALPRSHAASGAAALSRRVRAAERLFARRGELRSLLVDDQQMYGRDVLNGDRCTAHFRFPKSGTDEDDAWLHEALLRHGGQLTVVLESAPAQGRARFETSRSGQAFVDELNQTARWDAVVRSGWLPVDSPLE